MRNNLPFTGTQKIPKQDFSFKFCIWKGVFCRSSCKNPTKLWAGQVYLASLSIAPNLPVVVDFNRIWCNGCHLDVTSCHWTLAPRKVRTCSPLHYKINIRYSHVFSESYSKQSGHVRRSFTCRYPWWILAILFWIHQPTRAPDHLKR